MNHMLFAAIVSAICGPLASVQSTATRVDIKSPQNAPATKNAPGTARVAVINLGYVLNKYERATALKEEMQAEVKKMGEEVKRLQELVNVCQSALQKNEFKNGTKEEYEEKLIAGRRRLEDLNRQAKTKFGKASQVHLSTLWNDIHEAVKEYSSQHEIGLVMAYGEPLQKDDVSLFQSMQRKVGAIDSGGSNPFFVGPGVDISEAVTEFLNKRYRDGLNSN